MTDLLHDLPGEATPVEPKLCLWCDTALTVTNSIERSVCLRCYKLLRGAGIEDEEIFAGGSPEAR